MHLNDSFSPCKAQGPDTASLNSTRASRAEDICTFCSFYPLAHKAFHVIKNEIAVDTIVSTATSDLVAGIGLEPTTSGLSLRAALRCPKKSAGRCRVRSLTFSTAAVIAPSLHLPPAAGGRCGAPARARQSGSCGERTSSGGSKSVRLCGRRRRSGACEDEAPLVGLITRRLSTDPVPRTKKHSPPFGGLCFLVAGIGLEPTTSGL